MKRGEGDKICGFGQKNYGSMYLTHKAVLWDFIIIPMIVFYTLLFDGQF